MMELSFNRKTIGCYKKTAELYECVSASAECVVPDTQEDIRQILSSFFVTKIRSKDIDADEISIKAELSATVLYYSDNGIEALELSLPVNAKIPAKNTDSACKLIAKIRAEDWNVRIINPRKISLKADVGICASAYRENEIYVYQRPDELPEKMFSKNDDISASIIGTVSEKEITVSEEFELGSVGDCKFVCANSDFNYESSEAVGDKIVARFSAEVNAIFLSEGKLYTKQFSAPFSQIFDISGEEVGEIMTEILSTGEYYDFSDGRLMAEIHALIQLVHYESRELSFASDVYSCTSETTLNFESTELCTELCTESLKENFTLELEAQKEISEIVLTRAEPGKSDIKDETAITPVLAEVIYKDSENDIYCEKLRSTVRIPLPDSKNYKIASIKIHGLRAERSENKIILKGEIRLNMQKSAFTAVNSVASIETGEAFALPSASAYIVFSDEDIWSMAKKYKSSAEAIKEIESEGSRKYFVPVIK